MAGWLETDDPVVPCPTCRPELSEALHHLVPNPNDHDDGVKRAAIIGGLPRPSRAKPEEH